MASYFVGESVRVREVKGSPRPPAQWLGKRGRVLGLVPEAVAPDAPIELKKKQAPTRVELQYVVEIEGFKGTQSVPESWLART